MNHSDAAEVQQTVQLNMDSDGKSSEVIGKNTGTIHYEIGFTLMAYKKSDNSIHKKIVSVGSSIRVSNVASARPLVKSAAKVTYKNTKSPLKIEGKFKCHKRFFVTEQR